MPLLRRKLESIAPVESSSGSLKQLSVSAPSPYLGKQSESDPDIRELQISALPFLLPYRVARGRIEILRVFHEAQERPDHWER